MRKYNTTYYLLFLLLVTGAFASMAQNSYGLTIMGGVASAFAIVFLIQLIRIVRKKGLDDISQVMELSGLSVMSAILAMRVFYIHFQYVEIVFGLAGCILIVVYARKMINAFILIRRESTYLALMAVIFYSSIVLFLLSMTTIPFLPLLAEPAGMTAFGLILIFIAVSLYKGNVIFADDKITAIRLATRAENRSVVLISVFLLFSLYMGLTKVDLLPKVYSDEFPQSYFELVNRAESGQEIPVDGRFEHERFKEQYDLFIKRHSGTFNR
jgi:hypothetical protein